MYGVKALVTLISTIVLLHSIVDITTSGGPFIVVVSEH